LNFFEYIEQHKFSILGTIGIHILILVWLNLQLVVSVPYVANERVIMQLDFSEEEEEIEDQSEEIENNGTENDSPIANVATNASQEETTYTNQSFSQSQADQEVLDELKQLEAEEFNSIEHSEESESKSENETHKIDNNLIKEGVETNENASYGNDVKATASYYLPNRNPQRKPTPSYKCTTEGVVTVKIKVNQKGRVVSAVIDESKTNTQSECLRTEAISYGKRWRFTQNFNDESKKEGWIKFTYVSQ
jgi:TonB family protein